MKAKILITYFLALVGLISCEDRVSSKVYDNYSKIEGSWKLAYMEYADDSGEKHYLDKSQTTISFMGNSNRNTIGKISTPTGEFDFSYNLALENCSIDVSESESLPIDAPGRTNLFTIKFNKGSFEISTPKEYFKSGDKIFQNVVYRFERK